MEQDKHSFAQNPSIRDKHMAIYHRYNELIKKEMIENPLRAQYIGKSYYIAILSRDPMIGMTPDYIQRIINYNIKNGHNR
ncbi:MAG: hypothetical protein RR330_05465 [Alistipes sp.]